MEEKVVKIGFFKKLWYSITKFEQYPLMAAEGFKRAIKYLIGLTALVSLFAMIGSVIEAKNIVNELSKYVQYNIPEFSYSDGKVSMEIEQPIIIENADTGFDRIIVDPNVETDEQKQQIKNANSIEGMTVFFLKDEIMLHRQLDLR